MFNNKQYLSFNNIFYNIKEKEKSIVLFELENVLFNKNNICNYSIFNFYNYIIHLNLTPIIITIKKGSEFNINILNKQLLYNNIKIDKIYFLKETRNDIESYKNSIIVQLKKNGYNIVSALVSPEYYYIYQNHKINCFQIKNNIKFNIVLFSILEVDEDEDE